jgi:hypothetical protein
MEAKTVRFSRSVNFVSFVDSKINVMGIDVNEGVEDSWVEVRRRLTKK